MSNENNLKEVRDYLGYDSVDIISDERINLMLRICNNDAKQACIMSLGYIIRTIGLNEQQGELVNVSVEYYQAMLKSILE